MRLRQALPLVLLLTVVSLPASAQWIWGRPHPPRVGACFYQDPGFRGQYFCMRVNERWPSLPSGFNDRIRSIRVFNGARLRVFNDTDFRGVNLMLDGDADDLRRIRFPDDPRRSWDVRISSIAVFREHDEWEHREREGGEERHDEREERGY